MKSRTLTISELMKALNKIDDSDETPIEILVDVNKDYRHIVDMNLDSDEDVTLVLEEADSDEYLTMEEVIETLEDYGDTKCDGTQRLVYVDGSSPSSIESVIQAGDGNALLQTF